VQWMMMWRKFGDISSQDCFWQKMEVVHFCNCFCLLM
jgi:hypothetical protein